VYKSSGGGPHPLYDLLYRCVFVIRDIKSILKRFLEQPQNEEGDLVKATHLTNKIIIEFEKLMVLQSSMVERGILYDTTDPKVPCHSVSSIFIGTFLFLFLSLSLSLLFCL
jgi:hypothetical protein